MLRPALFAASAAALVLAACGANGQDEAPSSAATGAPVETRPPNNPDQKPALEGQTRAPSVSTTVAMQHALPALTTIQQPIAKLARAAVDLLLKRIDSTTAVSAQSTQSGGTGTEDLQAPSPMPVKLLPGRTA